MKIKHLFFVAFVLLFASCEIDDTNIAITEADLVGTWNLKKQTIDGSVDFTNGANTIKATYSGYAKDINMAITFADNPKKVSATGQYTLVAKVSSGGNTQTEEEVVEGHNDPDKNPTWVLRGNNITLSDDATDLPANLIVESYNGTTLTLKASIDETRTYGAESGTIKATIYMVLEK